MFCVYGLGVPFFFWFSLYKYRKYIYKRGLTVEENLKRTKTRYDKDLQPYHILFKPYIPSYWWWETLELLRRLAFSGGIYTFLSYTYGADSSSLPLLTAVCGVVLSYLHVILLNHYQPFYSIQDKIFLEYISWATFFTNFYGISELLNVKQWSSFLYTFLVILVESLNLLVIPLAILLFLVERWKIQVNQFIENQRIRIKKLFIFSSDDQPKGHPAFTEEHNLKSENGTKIHITTNEMQQQDYMNSASHKERQTSIILSEKRGIQRKKYVTSMKKHLSLKKKDSEKENADVMEDETSGLFFM